MPVMLKDAQEKVLAAVREKFGVEPGLRETVELAVQLTVEAIGFHVSASGEICDPRPEERFMPKGMEAKYGGGSRRRRGNAR